MRPRRLDAAACLLLLLPAGLAAQEMGARFSGYFEHQASTTRRDGRWTLLDYDRIRLNLDARAGRGVSGSAGLIYQLFRGDTRVPLASALPSALRPLVDTASVVLDDRNFLNHAYVTLGSGAVQVTAGKQYLTWGAAYAFNPTELFRPKNVFEPGYDREGVGAASVKAAVGPLSEVLVAFVPNGGFGTSGKVARLRHHVGGFDVSALAAELHEVAARDSFSGTASLERRFTVGGDLTGEVLGLGVWAEGTWSDHAGAQWLEATIGSNYTFGDGTYVMVEAFVNGRGQPGAEPYPATAWLGRLSGDRRTLGRVLVYGVVSRPLRDLWTLGFAGLRNVGDRSMALIPSVAYSFAQNVDLLFNGIVTIGRDGTEYGTGGSGGFLRARVYF